MSKLINYNKWKGIKQMYTYVSVYCMYTDSDKVIEECIKLLLSLQLILTYWYLLACANARLINK